MDTTTVAQPARTVPEETRERVLRGLLLQADHATEIEHTGHGRYTVPGCKGGSYIVDLAPFGDEETCSCPDFKRHKAPCKHLFAATISRARTRAAARKEQSPKVSPEAVEANLSRLGA